MTPLIDGSGEGQKEKPSHHPLNCFDAREWAKEFNITLEKIGEKKLDEGFLIAWFANAIMTGYDNHRWKVEAEAKHLLTKGDSGNLLSEKKGAS